MATPTPLTVTAKYYIGQVAYVIFYSSIEIRPVVIKEVFLAPNGSLRYRVVVADDVWARSLEEVKEEELYSFDEARTVLLSFLNLKVAEINTMVQPV